MAVLLQIMAAFAAIYGCIRRCLLRYLLLFMAVTQFWPQML